MMSIEAGQNIAVIGSGIAGITAAYLLSKRHNVTIFEGDDRIGGHTHTVLVPYGSDEVHPIDTGFIVLNDRTYPLLHKLFREWGVHVRSADMSFGYYDELTGLMYGSKDVNMLLACRQNLLNLDFWKMIRGVLKFWKALPRDLDKGSLKGLTLREYVEDDYGESFIQNYLIPFSAAIWSTSCDNVLEMPAEHCARFFINHGMISYYDSPKWQTVIGGSHAYLQAFQKQFTGTIRLNTGVVSIKRNEVAVDLQTIPGETLTFDHIVIATHADQALGLLEDPSEEETRLLGVWKYSTNQTVLHTDNSFLPAARRGIAGWNCRRFLHAESKSPVCLTYHMNTLQGLTSSMDYCVTLNPHKDIAAEKIIKEFEYTHPVFDEESYATQALLPSLNNQNRTFYCGSYFSWGFHEDAVRSAAAVGLHFGIEI